MNALISIISLLALVFIFCFGLFYDVSDTEIYSGTGITWGDNREITKNYFLSLQQLAVMTAYEKEIELTLKGGEYAGMGN